jgi:hypothetical protein
LSSRGELCLIEVKLSLGYGGETLCSPLHSSKQKRVFTPGTKGTKFTPRGKLWLLKTGLSLATSSCAQTKNLLLGLLLGLLGH